MDNILIYYNISLIFMECVLTQNSDFIYENLSHCSTPLLELVYSGWRCISSKSHEGYSLGSQL